MTANTDQGIVNTLVMEQQQQQQNTDNWKYMSMIFRTNSKQNEWRLLKECLLWVQQQQQQPIQKQQQQK